MSKKSDYERVRAVWYQKLKEEGFNDIEKDETRLHTWSLIFGQRHTAETMQAKAAYSHMADRFLQEYEFSGPLEKIIWEYHANGLSVRDIVVILNDTKIVKAERNRIWRTIQRLERQMKNRYLIGFKENNE